MQYRAMLKIALPFAIGLMVGLAVNAWRYGADIADLKAQYAVERQTLAEAHAKQLQDALAKQKAAEARVAALDEQHTKELSDAQAENNRLRDAVADGERRLRIKANCPAANGVSETSGASGVADDGTVELDRETGSLVFSLRSDLIRARAMIRGLQDYVREVCLH